ncbi:hypothetical protein MICRO80W_720019 [Micrococcus luteus]|nr:hypothetical protein MICRO80W_720019 [Micrococcus luteus]
MTSRAPTICKEMTVKLTVLDAVLHPRAGRVAVSTVRPLVSGRWGHRW